MEATSVPDFLEKCLNNRLAGKKDMPVFYRGVNQRIERNPHIPSLYYPPDTFYEQEDIIFKEVISVFPEQMLAQKLTIEKLFLMRHYGFPTRLLDISKNPLVDLFFACFTAKGHEYASSRDGVVYRYAVPTDEIRFTGSDTVTILANICKTPSSFYVHNEKHWDHYLYDIREDKPHFYQDLCKPEALNDVVCIRPRMNNPRIIRQDGYFFLFGIKGTKAQCAKMPPEWIKESIIIPAKYKNKILHELDSMGYNEGFFYPDFEHLSNIIRARYRHKTDTFK